jgi:hypothetical protein
MCVGNQRITAKENCMMIGGTGLKKSTILKTLKALVRNDASCVDAPGVFEELCGIGMNTVWVPKSDDELLEGGVEQGEEETRLKLQACQLVPWYRFNERLTFEGLIDIANEVGHDGPRVHLAMDELSLLVSGVSNRKSHGCLSLDELILFLDEGSEVAKGASAKRRRLMDCHATACLGVQAGVLPEVLGSNSDRNVLGRFTTISTEEYRALDAVGEEVLWVDLLPIRRSFRSSFAATLSGAWGPSAESSPRCGTTHARVLLRAFNASLRAARDYGVQGDPMVAWLRKADELLYKLYVGVYVEVESDIRSLNPMYAFGSTVPLVVSWLAVSCFCRVLLDIRTALNEGFLRKSRTQSMSAMPPSAIPSLPTSELAVTPCELLQHLILKHGHMTDAEMVVFARNAYAGALKQKKWANRYGVKAAWVSLCDVGLAMVDTIDATQVDRAEAVPATVGPRFVLSSTHEMNASQLARRNWLLDIPESRRGKRFRVVDSALPPSD